MVLFLHRVEIYEILVTKMFTIVKSVNQSLVDLPSAKIILHYKALLISCWSRQRSKLFIFSQTSYVLLYPHAMFLYVGCWSFFGIKPQWVNQLCQIQSTVFSLHCHSEFLFLLLLGSSLILIIPDILTACIAAIFGFSFPLTPMWARPL